MSALLRQRRTWLGIAVSVVALWLVLRGVDWQEMQAALVGADYVWLLPAAASTVLVQVVRTLRWRVLFGGAPKPAPWPAFCIVSIGYLVNSILPLRLGDFVRAWLADTRTPAGGAEALATVFIERVLDLLTIFFLVALWAADPISQRLDMGPLGEPWSLRALVFTGIALFYLGAAFAASQGDRARRWLGRGALGEQLARFLEAFGPLGTPRVALGAALWSIALWLLGVWGYWLVFRVFHLDLSFGVALLTLGATAVLAILPSSPGYVGVFHSGVVGTLLGLGLADQATAVSYALVLHGITTLMLLAMGLVGLWGLGLSWRGLSAQVESGVGAGVASAGESGGAPGVRRAGTEPVRPTTEPGDEPGETSAALAAPDPGREGA